MKCGSIIAKAMVALMIPTILLGMFCCGAAQEKADESVAEKPEQEEPPLQDTERAADRGFRMFVAFNRVYIPKDTPKKPKKTANTNHQQSKEGFLALGFFACFMDGKLPVHNTFEIKDAPVPVIWKSSNPRAVKLLDNLGCPQTRFCDPGFSIISVSTGNWSEKCSIRVVRVPFWLGMPVAEVIQKYGQPQFKRDHSPDYRTSFYAGSSGEKTWEYDKWPRCGLVISNNAIVGIVTVPAASGANSGTCPEVQTFIEHSGRGFF